MGEAPGVLLRDVSNIPAQEVNNNDDTEASSETGAPQPLPVRVQYNNNNNSPGASAEKIITGARDNGSQVCDHAQLQDCNATYCPSPSFMVQ